MPRPVECVSVKNEKISLCGELTELRDLRRNGKGDSYNIQMVFSRNGFMLAGVAFPPNEEPEGRRFAENLAEGRYYVLQKYTVGDSKKSPMKSNMAENVVLDWRYPIEEVPFEKIMVDSKISTEQRGFNREFQEAGPGKARTRQRDPGLFDKIKSIEDGQRTVDGFVSRRQRTDVHEEEERVRRDRSMSGGRRRSTSRGRSAERRERWSVSRERSRTRNLRRSASRERSDTRRSTSRGSLRRSPSGGRMRRSRSRSTGRRSSRTRERSTSKASSRVSRSRTRSESRSSVKSRSRTRSRSTSVLRVGRLDESSEDAEEDVEEGDKVENEEEEGGDGGEEEERKEGEGDEEEDEDKDGEEDEDEDEEGDGKEEGDGEEDEEESEDD